MRGMYTAAVKITGITTAAPRTLMVLTAPAAKVVAIHEFTITNTSNSTSFQTQCAIYDITSFAAGTGFTALTPAKHEPGDQAAGSTVSYGSSSSTEPTTMASASRTEEGGNSLLGYQLITNEYTRVYVAPGATVAFRMMVSPPASTDFDVRVVFQEVG